MIALIAIPVALLIIFTLMVCRAASDVDDDEEQAKWCEDYLKEQEQKKQKKHGKL